MKNPKKTLLLGFIVLQVSIIFISYSVDTSNQSSMSSRIIVEDNTLNYTSTFSFFPEQLENLSEQVRPRVVEEYFTKSFKEDLYISNELLDVTEFVTPRFRIEYASETFYDQILDPPYDLQQVTSLCKPRITIEYSTLLFTASLVQPAEILPWIIICNETGQEKNIFNVSENVYIRGGSLPPETNITLYIIPDSMSASFDNVIATCWALTGSDGEFSLTLAWANPLIEGDYDIWVDINQNGICDETIDIYDDSAFDIYVFTVIPEFPSFLILPLFMIATLLSVIIWKKYIKLNTHIKTGYIGQL